MLQEIHNTWKTSDTTKRDSRILDFLLLPRLLLAASATPMKLAATLFRHLHQQTQPGQDECILVTRSPYGDFADDDELRATVFQRGLHPALYNRLQEKFENTDLDDNCQ